MNRGLDDLSGLSPWADELAKTFVSLASDIALVIDDSGIITNVAQSRTEPMAPGASTWIGRPWVDTVSGDTRRKIELLMQEVTSTGSARRREVNHLTVGGGIPVAYTAVRLGANGPVLAAGRDLRSIAAIQQRFLDSQQELERGYWRVREAETRERRLQQVASDVVLVVDAPTLTVLQASDSLVALFGPAGAPLAGRPIAELFDAHSRGPLDELLVTARGMGRPVEIRARLAGSHTGASVAATPFRAGDEQRLLVRVRGAEQTDHRQAHPAGMVVIGDSSGRLMSCTSRVVEFVGADGESALHGQTLAQALGGDPDEVSMLIARARRDGLAHATITTRSAGGARVTLRSSAILLTEGDQECIGFVLTLPSAEPDVAQAVEVPHTAHGSRLVDTLALLAGQLGEASLRELVRDAGALVEQHLIGVALERTAGDEQAAAALLGLSRATLRRRRRLVRGRDGHLVRVPFAPEEAP